MKVFIDYADVLETEIEEQIDFIREEFQLFFGHKETFSDNDQNLAEDLIAQLAKRINTSSCIEHLIETLEELEEQYPALF